VNHNRTERIYRTDLSHGGADVEAAAPSSPDPDQARAPRDGPRRMNERWSLDFVSDITANGQAIRALAVVDDYTSE
jgi:putative transposase